MADLDRLGDLLPAGAKGGAARPAGRKGPGAGEPGTAGAPGGDVGGGEDLARRLAAVWADVVGAEVAANARPVQLRDGRLVVTTSSSAWAQSLQLMSPMVVAGLTERLGEGSVAKAVFRHAGWDPAWSTGPGEAGSAAGEPTPAASAARRAPRLREATGSRPGRGQRKQGPHPGLKVAPGSGAEGVPREAGLPEDPAGEEAILPAGPGPDPSPKRGVFVGFSAEERQALAELDQLPLPSAVKDTIREAMKAGFVRARQDSGRS